MSDVFISYARSTERQAKQVAEALRGHGYRVWRDDELPAHRSYGEVIEERLTAAKAVVVVWSAEAVKSEWVRFRLRPQRPPQGRGGRAGFAGPALRRQAGCRVPQDYELGPRL